MFSFGLLHGLGFAGALREVGLPRSEFVTALFTFNLGVEAAQLAVIGRRSCWWAGIAHTATGTEAVWLFRRR